MLKAALALLLMSQNSVEPAGLLQRLQFAESRADRSALQEIVDPGAMSFQVGKGGDLTLVATPRQWAESLDADSPAREVLSSDCRRDLCILRSTRGGHTELMAALKSSAPAASGGWRIVGRVLGTDAAERAADKAEVRSLIERKLKSMDARDPQMLASCYHPRAMSYFAEAGPGGTAPAAVSIAEWVGRFAEDRAAGKVQPRTERRIELIELHGDIGYVRFTHTSAKSTVTDYVLVARLAIGWRIANLTFTVAPNAE